MSSFILSGLMLVVLLTGCSSSQSNRPEEQTAAGPYDEILAAADARRDTFSGRTTETEAEGTVYYISNSGNDENDGLSPETAWATLGRAFETHWPLTRNFLQPGDAVLLERGGTWYVSPDDIDGLTSDAYNIVEGVTLGAYGEGARPVIRGDLPQANDPDFWTLYHSENGVQIWTCAEKLQDSNVLVLNGGEGWINGLILQVDGPNSIFSAAVENCMGGCNHDGISFTDNIFCGFASWLLCLTDNLWNLSGKVNQPMVFSGNVYAQPKDGGLCNFNWERGWGAGYAPDEQEFLDFIGDETGSVVPIPWFRPAEYKPKLSLAFSPRSTVRSRMH